MTNAKKSRTSSIRDSFILTTERVIFFSSQFKDTTLAEAAKRKVEELSIRNIPTIADSLFFLDFTPDNVFIVAGKLKFLDPWKQPSYRGLSTISLGQFCTLARDVYKLPNGERFYEEFDSWYKATLPNALELQLSILISGFMLGRTLQFTLSAYARTYSNPILSQKYYEDALACLKEV